MTSVTLKAIFNGDIRRLTVPASFADLKTTIAGLFPTAGTNLSLKYDDSEGELVTISTQGELEQAVKDAAAAKKTLRIIITASQQAPQVPVPELKIPAAAETPREAATAAPAAEKKQEPERPDCAELKRLAFAFFTDAQVLAALPEALTGVVDAMMEAQAKNEVLTARGVIAKLLAADALKNHASVQRVLPFLPTELPCLDEKIKALHEYAPIFGPVAKWLIAKLPHAVAALPSIIEAVSSIPPHIKFMLMRKAFKLLRMARFVCPGLAECWPLFKCFASRCGGEENGCESKGQEEEESELPPFMAFLGPLAAMLGGQGMPPFPFPGMGMFGGMGGCPPQQETAGPQGCPYFAGRRGFGMGPCGPRGFGGPHWARRWGGRCGGDRSDAPQQQQESGDKTIHHGIVCDGCQATPIVGTRFKCTVCNDFDLCEQCEAKGVHQADHPLMKLKMARRGPGHHGFGGHGHGHRGGPWHHWRRFARGCGGESEGPSASPCSRPQAQATQTAAPQQQSQGTQATPNTESKTSQTQQQQQSLGAEESVGSHKPASIPAVAKPASESNGSSGQSLADKYAVQLNALESMGFNNRDLNVYMLERYGGNVQSVANWLLEKMRQ